MKLKNTILSAFAVVAVSTSSHGFVVSTSNLISCPVIDASGALIPFNGGSVAVGYFSTLADGGLASTDIATLQADFQQLGASASFANGFTVDAFFDVEVGAPLAAGSPFIGKNVYVWLGNGTTTLNSDEVAVWKGDLFFVDDQTSVGGSVTMAQADFAKLLVGIDGGAVHQGGIDSENSIQLVPEPSTALLGLGGLALMLRRRRN